jgi:hypothetical protein
MSMMRTMRICYSKFGLMGGIIWEIVREIGSCMEDRMVYKKKNRILVNIVLK